MNDIQIGTLEMRQLHPDDIIILHFNMDNTDIWELTRQFKSVQDIFPNNKVIALESKMRIDLMTKEKLLEHLS
jgi:hypothetical protein